MRKDAKMCPQATYLPEFVDVKDEKLSFDW